MKVIIMNHRINHDSSFSKLTKLTSKCICFLEDQISKQKGENKWQIL